MSLGLVYEPTHLLSEGRVGLGVEDEGVPADVHERRRAVVCLWLVGAERQEGERLVHDALREGALHGLVLDDASDEVVPELLVDLVLVDRGVAGRHLNGSGHIHCTVLPREDRRFS